MDPPVGDCCMRSDGPAGPASSTHFAITRATGEPYAANRRAEALTCPFDLLLNSYARCVSTIQTIHGPSSGACP